MESRAVIPSPVQYQIYRGADGEAPGPGRYTYRMAGNGVFKSGANDYFTASVPVCPARIAGLPDLAPSLALTYGRISASLLVVILRDARRLAWEKPREAMYHIRCDGTRYWTTRPNQEGSAAHLAYHGGDSRDIVVDLHSHCEMPAFFSSTDDRDEQGLRIYAVIGKIFTVPEIRIRVGVYGDYMPVPVTWVFEGVGPFRDMLGVGLRRYKSPWVTPW